MELAKESGTAGGGRLQCRFGNTRRGQEGGGHRNVAGNVGTGRHGKTLPSKGEEVVSGPEDVGDAPKGEGGEVLDGIHPGDGHPSLQERRRPGPSAQLGPLHGPGMSAERPPDGTQAKLGREEAVASEAAAGANTDGPTFRGSTERRTESATTRGKIKRLDLGVDVETHRRESLRTPGPAIQAVL